MDNKFEDIQIAINNISEDVKLVKTQTVKNAVSLDDVNSSLSKINEKDNVTTELLYDTQNKLAGYITSNVNNEISLLSKNIDILKTSFKSENEAKAVETREILGGLSVKISAIQDSLKETSNENYTELKGVLENLSVVLNETINNVEKTFLKDVSTLNYNVENISKDLNEVKNLTSDKMKEISEDLAKSQGNIFSAYTEKMQNSINTNIYNLSKGFIENQENMLSSYSEKLKESMSDNVKNLSADFIQYQENVLFAYTEKIQGSIGSVDDKVKALSTEFINAQENLLSTYSERIQTSANDNIKTLSTEFVNAQENLLSQYSEKLQESLNDRINDLSTDIIETQENLFSKYSEKLQESVNDRMNNLSTDIAETQENLFSAYSEKLQNVINAVNSLNTRFDFDSVSNSEKMTALTLDITNLKTLLEEINNSMTNSLSYNVSEIKNIVNTIDINSIQNKVETLSEILSSFRLDEKFSAINGQFEAVKYAVQQSGTNSNILEQLTSYSNELQKLMNTLSENSENNFNEFKQAMKFFNDSLMNISKENEDKFGETLRETSAIKMDILNLKDCIDETSIKDAETIEEKFNLLFVELSRLEHSLEEKNDETLKQNIENSEKSFEMLVQTLKNSDSSSYLESLVTEKAELLKNELNLATTDILNNYSEQNKNLTKNLESLTENIRNIVEASLYKPFEMVKQELQYYLKSFAESSENFDLISGDIKNAENNLAKILTEIGNETTKTSNEISQVLNNFETMFSASKNISENFRQNNSELLKYIDAKTNEIQIHIDELFQTDALSELQNALTVTLSDKMNALSLDTKDFLKENFEKISQNNLEMTEFLKEQLSEIENTLFDEINRIPASSENQTDITAILIKEIECIFNDKFDSLEKGSISEEMDTSLSNIQEQIDTLRTTLLDEFSTKFQDLKEFNSTQNGMMKISSEIKKMLEGFEDKVVETNVNSTMEISKLLFSVLNEVSKLKVTEVNENEIRVSSRQDMDLSVVEKTVNDAKDELKKILAIQHPLIKKIENLADKEELDVIHNNIKQLLVAFNTKLDNLISTNKEYGGNSDLRSVIENIERTINEFGKDMIASVIKVFNGINFDVEKQEIKDFVQSKYDDMKQMTSDKLSNLTSEMKSNSRELLELAKNNKIDIVNEIRDVLYEKLKDQIYNFSEKNSDKLSEIKELLYSAKDQTLNPKTVSELLTAKEYQFETRKLDVYIHEISELIMEKLVNVDKFADLVKDEMTEMNSQISSLNDIVIDVVKNTFIEIFDEKYSGFIDDVDNMQNLCSSLAEDLHNLETWLKESKTELVSDITEPLILKIEGLNNSLSESTKILETNSNENCKKVLENIEKSKLLTEELNTKTYNYLSETLPELLTEKNYNLYFEKVNSRIDEIVQEFVSGFSSVECLNTLINDQTNDFKISLEDLASNVSNIVKETFKEELNTFEDTIKDLNSKVLSEMNNFTTKSLKEYKSFDENFVNIKDELSAKFDEIIANVNNSLVLSSEKSEMSKNDILNLENKIYDFITENFQNIQTSELSSEQTAQIKNEIEKLGKSLISSISTESIVKDIKEINKEFKDDIFSDIEILKATTNKSNLQLSDIKDLISNKFEDLDDIKKEISLLPKENGINLDEIEDVFSKGLEELKQNLDFSNQNKISLDEIEDVFSKGLEELKQNLDFSNQNKISLDEIEDVFSKGLEELKQTLDFSNQNKISLDEIETAVDNIFSDKIHQIELALLNAQDNSDVSANKIYDLIDSKTKDIKNQIHNLSDKYTVDDIKDVISECFEDIKINIKNLIFDLDNADLIKDEFIKIQDTITGLEITTDEIRTDLKDLQIGTGNSEFIKDGMATIQDSISDLEKTTESIKSDLNNISDSLDNADVKDELSKIQDSIKELDNTSLLNTKFTDVKDELSKIQNSINELDNTSLLNTNFTDVKDKLDNIESVTDNMDIKCVDIKSEISTLKEHLSQIQNSIKNNDSDYPYSFEDVETDILKVRMILKELTETNALARDEGLEKIEEDLVSISTRTNKLLLNSDETANFLTSSIEELKNLVTLFDNKVSDFDYQIMFDKLEERLNEISEIAYSNVQENRKLSEAFTYLAEWIDKTDEKLYELEQRVDDISYVKENMISKSDLEDVFDRIIRKMDQQQEQIVLLEDKVKQLSSNEPNIKSVVREVLSTVPETMLAKKVDGIDKQLATMGKNIEKITSYVD